MFERRDGFTLVELLIVVVIIGVLATIALPKLAGAREGTNFTAVQSDLRNLMHAQALHYTRNDFAYTDAIADLADLFQETVNVTITMSMSGSAQGWWATASHNAIANAPACAIFVGDAAPVAPATQEGVVGCDRT